MLDFLQPAVFDNDNENLRSSAYCKATKSNRVKTKFNPVEIKSKSLETQSKSLENESSRLLDFFSTELVYFSTELNSFSRLSDKNLGDYILLDPINHCGYTKRKSESERFAHMFDKSIRLIRKWSEIKARLDAA